MLLQSIQAFGSARITLQADSDTGIPRPEEAWQKMVTAAVRDRYRLNTVQNKILLRRLLVQYQRVCRTASAANSHCARFLLQLAVATEVSL